MPLVSLEPESFELPDLRLVGTGSFADYFANEQWPQIGET